MLHALFASINVTEKNNKKTSCEKLKLREKVSTQQGARS